jgi:hypothetical protein
LFTGTRSFEGRRFRLVWAKQRMRPMNAEYTHVS